MAAPNSYKDPYWSDLAAGVEQKLELPKGLLSSIVMHGERSNADQVSDAGARTPFQILPVTRNAAIKKYGIDAYLSPENAAEVAGLLLKDSMKRNSDDVAQAVGEYIGGTDRSNWGRTTRAYIDRVMVGQNQAKTKSLAEDFAKFMEANPAIPAAAPAKPAPNQELAAGFGQWLQQQAPSDQTSIPGLIGSTRAALIPGEDGKPVAPMPIPAEPTIGQQIVGSGEAGISALTGATGGSLGMAAGLIHGLAGAILRGEYGTPAGANAVEQSMSEGAKALTYAPRTAAGQEQAAAIGNALQNIVPAAGLLGEMAMAGRAASAAMPAAKGASSAALKVGTQAAQEAADAAKDAVAAAGKRIMRSEAAAEQNPVTSRSAGAAATDVAAMRRMEAESLPVPIELTKGQATRQFEQTRFEQELAKDPLKGEPLRQRFADQNHAMLRNFDVWIDSTGAGKADLPSIGDAVKKAIAERATADKNRIRVAYKNAEKGGEMEEPVSLPSVVQYLNDNAPDAVVAPVLDAARARAVRLGVATIGQDGELVAQPVALKTAELFRRAVSNATDAEPTNIRHSAQIKSLVDQATDGLGGNMYREARSLRARYAQNYENIGLVYDLMNNKRGMSDAKIAPEDVFRRSMLNSSMADVRQMRRILQTGGEEGKQAWRELQGATLRHIQDEATKNVARDTRGNQIISAAALDRSISALDKSGKLDFIFGKHGAEKLRVVNDLAKYIYTSPPGAINHSNTASVILAAMDMATSGLAGMPLPVMSGLRILTTHIKDRRIRHRINDALGIKQQPKKASEQPKTQIVPTSAPSARHENKTIH